jgi:hypothetical protein
MVVLPFPQGRLILLRTEKSWRMVIGHDEAGIQPHLKIQENLDEDVVCSSLIWAYGAHGPLLLWRGAV